MNQLFKTPKELPNPNEEVLKKPDVKKGIFKPISTAKDELYKWLNNWQPAVLVDIMDKKLVKLTLSWERNVKKLRNRMTKHMEAYPETKYGFIVEFMGDKSNKLFIVRPCHDGEAPSITIKWIKYKIIEKTGKLDPLDDVNESTKLEIMEELRHPTADKTPEEQIKNGMDTLPTGPDTLIDNEHYKEEIIKVFEDSGRIDD